VIAEAFASGGGKGDRNDRTTSSVMITLAKSPFGTVFGGI
jgi:hypothetical protein